MRELSDLGKEQREELVDDVAETMSDACDMDVSFSQYAEAVVKMLEKRGLLPHQTKETRNPLWEYNSGRAVIENNSIVVRVPFDFLPQIAEGAWASSCIVVRLKITDVMMFAKELASSLNREEEDGTTLIHKMFDAAINDATENGAAGIEDHSEQEA